MCYYFLKCTNLKLNKHDFKNFILLKFLANISLSDDDSSNDSFYDESAAEIQDMRSTEVSTPAEINYVAEVGSSPIGTWEQHTKVYIILFISY